MVTFPNCKINLGLNILRKRIDGYHDIESVFLPIPLFDALEIVKTKETKAFSFSTSGLSVPGNAMDNLCIKAYQLLLQKHKEIEPVQMHLHKAIPTGGGLGGGSADGAFALKLLNDYFKLNLSITELEYLALQLGSDCPFFILNQPTITTGRGEHLIPIEINLKGYRILIVNPGVHISTAEMFGKITPAIPQESLLENIKLPPEYWMNKINNDFEAVVFMKHPELKMLKEQLLLSGAVYASLSGSGSTLYGIFKKEDDINLNFKNYFTFSFCP
ncbi:MAG: 4-(cytidine 5'-diphospho)-2-C-methyl-D-erythritol kinase [Bacteroidetes bacterium]|nr:4-(cytidine 5'-diphospho)-2-C-methyl-D-erythritol kinase [Bacteroidota bacterium]